MMEAHTDTTKQDNKIVIELEPSAIAETRDRFLRAIKLRNVRGISVFMGFGEEKAFTIPSKQELAPRARRNAFYFAANYAVLASLVTVVLILLNPMFLFVLICLTGLWLYSSSAAANESPENPVLVFGRPVTPDQRRFGLAALSFAVILFFGGSVLLTICTASGALAVFHSILRDSDQVPAEDELGFLSDDIETDKIADVV